MGRRFQPRHKLVCDTLSDGSRLLVLSHGKATIVDAEDYESLSVTRWFYTANGYAVRRHDSIQEKPLYMHRILLQALDGEFVDHINNDRLDNRRKNLRLSTNQENSYNRGKNANNASGFKGVSHHKNTGKFQSQIRASGKSLHIGYFPTALEAAAHYDLAARKYHGEFAHTNFPPKSPTNNGRTQ